METPIKGSWQFRQADSKKWYRAQVPGTVHSDLLNNKLINDPFYRFNEDELQWIEEKDWEYLTTFVVDEATLSKEFIRLFFKGLDTYARVYLNDTLVLETDNMFVGENVYCKEKLRLGENTLRVYFDSPVQRGMERLKAFGHLLQANNEQAPEEKRTNIFTRKAPFHYGWDWGPRLVTSGIWRPVELQAWNKAKIDNLYVVTRSISEDKATLDAELEILSGQTNIATVCLLVNNRKAFVHENINLTSGSNKVSFAFSIDQPRLWWPNGMGEPYQYNLTFQLESNNEILHRYDLEYGVRMVQLVQEPDSSGRSFFFKVNGHPVFMKGANIIPSDTLTPRVTEKTYNTMINNAVAANMNMLRVWGGAIYEEDIFYRLCNENGILVWQDFMFACNLQPGNDQHLKNIQREAEYNVKRLRNNACIALWCGNNENLLAWHKWGWSEMYEQEMRDYLWRTYETIFYEILPETVAAFDPKNSYWPSSPSTWDNKLADRKSGDEHDWTIWFGHKPFQAYWENPPRFASEWGLQAFPEMATINEISVPEDHAWDSRLMRHRQRSKMNWFEPGFDGNDNIRKYMKMYYQVPEKFSDFIYVSQLLQAKGYKTAIEAHRTNMPVCMGSLYWQLNDSWPTISWATLDYYYRWKASHYAVKKAFEPVIVTSKITDGLIKFYVVSDLLASFEALLEVKLINLNGTVYFTQKLHTHVKANSSTMLYSKNFMAYLNDIDPADLVLSYRLKNKEGVIAENLLYFREPKDMHLPAAVISHTIKNTDEQTFTLAMETDNLVMGLYISFDDPDIFLSDNYFDLLPGETRTVSVKTSKKIKIGKPTFKHLKSI